MTLYDIVKKLAGPIDPVGETNADTKRLENLDATIDLVDRLIFDLAESAKAKDRQEASMATIGRKSHRFLKRVEEWIRDEVEPYPPRNEKGEKEKYAHMKRVTGYIKTTKVGSSCEFDFEIDDDATEEEIEEEAKEAAFNLIEWNFTIEDT